MPRIDIDPSKKTGRSGDYSMLLEMKRRQIGIITQRAEAFPNKSGITDSKLTRGDDNNTVKALYVTRGAFLDFIPFR
jgi:hypothetical protein